MNGVLDHYTVNWDPPGSTGSLSATELNGNITGLIECQKYSIYVTATTGNTEDYGPGGTSSPSDELFDETENEGSIYFLD